MAWAQAAEAPAATTQDARPARDRASLEKRAAEGDREAMFLLGVMHARGRGAAKDAAQAAEWYRRAADLGEARAMANLGVLYARGEGVAKDD